MTTTDDRKAYIERVRAAVPELLDWPNWVNYKLVPRPGKKPNKPPINPHTGKTAESNNPATWGSFDQAAAAYLKSKQLAGLGFVFTNTPYCGVDLDHCLADDTSPEHEELCIDIVGKLGSYTETSPSGDGLHVIVRGELEAYAGRQKQTGATEDEKVEIYDTESPRYFTVTGEPWGALQPIAERTPEINECYLWVFGPPPAYEPQDKPKTTSTPPPAGDDLEAEIADALRYIPPTGAYQNHWLTVLMAIHDALPNGRGIALAESWSPGYPGEIEKKFASFSRTKKGGITARSLFKIAIDNGWQPPAKVKPKATGKLAAPAPPPNFDGDETPPPDPDRVATWLDLDGLIGPIEWLWDGWLPKGMLTIAASEPGVGKSGACLGVGAVILTGSPWPDGTPSDERGAILWAESEAGQAINLDRAKKWGLPLEKIVTPFENPLIDFKLDDVQHQRALEAQAYRPEIKLIIIDSLRAAHSKDENNSEVIGIVQRLAELARDAGKPILLTHHLRKRGIFDGDGVSLDRLRGSSAITQPARVVWGLDIPDPHNQPDNKRIQVIKSNLARFPEPIGMTLNESGIYFGAAPTPPQTYTELDKAIDMLKDLLSNGKQPSAYIYDEGEAAGISRRTLERAKKAVGAHSIKTPEGWFWGLPARDD